MKKAKPVRKLKLQKETLSDLQSRGLSKVNGGADKYTFTCQSYNGNCDDFTFNADCW